MSPWFQRIAQFLRYPVFRKLLVSVLVYAAYAIGVQVLEIPLFGKDIEFPAGVYTFFGLVLSILLVFRTNSSYDRWWEGRRLWGILTQESRHLSQLVATASLPVEEKAKAKVLQAEFPVVLREHLRSIDVPRTHGPLRVTTGIYQLMARWRELGLDHFTWSAMERHLAVYQDVTGGCERIRRTPPPLSHRAVIPQILIVYLLMLPWGLPNGMATVGEVSLVAYFMISLELIAEELEDPFGHEPDDLPLEAMGVSMQNALDQVYAVGLSSGASEDK